MHSLLLVAALAPAAHVAPADCTTRLPMPSTDWRDDWLQVRLAPYYRWNIIASQNAEQAAFHWWYCRVRLPWERDRPEFADCARRQLWRKECWGLLAGAFQQNHPPDVRLYLLDQLEELLDGDPMPEPMECYNVAR